MSQLVGDPREPVVEFQSEVQQAQDPGKAGVSIQVQRQEKADGLVGRQSGRRKKEGQPFCAIQAFP